MMRGTMKKRTWKISIIKLLILSNSFIMAVFFFTSSYFSQKSYKEVFEEEFKVKQFQMLVYISDTLEQSMKSIELLARSTANNYGIINNIINYRKNQNSYEQLVFQKNMNKNLSSVAYSLKDIVSVNILMDENALRTTQTNGVYDYDSYASDDYSGLIREMSLGWISTRKNNLCVRSNSSYIVSYVLRIYSGLYYGDGIGHLVINLDEKMFYEQIKNYHQETVSAILFVGEDGVIISSTDREVHGKKLADTKYSDYQEISTQGDQVTVSMQNKIISKKQLGNRNSYVLAISDYDKVTEPIRRIQELVLLFSLALLAVFGFASGVIAYRVSKPILKLSNEVAKFDSNNFNQLIDVSTNISEIDILCNRFNEMTVQIENLIKSLIKQEKLKQKKEFEILQAQINPHFLYNTLESINWMALSMNQKEISNMVIQLGNFLRLSLNKGKNIYYVRDEINHLKCYMEIQNVRSKGKILFSADVEDEILDYRMIKLLLQPLVENSIIHGMDFRGGMGRICLKAYRAEDYMYFIITDDGCGMSPELIGSIYDMTSDIGHGLKNVMKRINLYYGEDCGLTINSRLQVGTTIEIKIRTVIPNQ